MVSRQALIQAGFDVIAATRLHRFASPLTRGLGAILTFHHVRPEPGSLFAPNKLLAITPEFLDCVIRRLHDLGYAIVSMDEAISRMLRRAVDRRFAVLTFDDGFRDNLTHALPILERHNAPATFYVTTGFADGNARLWWIELEEVVRRAEQIVVTIAGERLRLDVRSAAEKSAAYSLLYWRLRKGPEGQLRSVIGELCERHGVDPQPLVESLCLDWQGVEMLSRHPLATVGAHTVSHPMLAKHDDARVRAELEDGKAVLERRLGRPVRHLAYPVGDHTSAGRREFCFAAEAGYASGVTTRPGLIFPEHRDRLMSLPRVSVNGNHQSMRDLDILLSGVAFAIWNKGRRVAPI